MRKIVVTTLVLALALVTLAATGCTNPIKDANAAIESGNVHLEKYKASQKKVSQTATELNSINAVTPEEAAKALELLAQLKQELAAGRTELEAASKDIAKVKQYEVPEEYKKYADLQVKAIAAQVAIVDEGEKLYTEMERHYTAIKDGKATAQLANEILTKIDTISANITQLTQAAAEAKKAADDYFAKAAAAK